MPVFMVGRDLHGLSIEQLSAAQQAVIETAHQLTSQDKPVRDLRSTFVAGDAWCMCPFEAPQASHVRELNDTAKLPYRSIAEALDLTP
jgi:hypothetical protein